MPVLEPLFKPATLSRRYSIKGVFLQNFLNFKETYFEEHLQTNAPDILRGVIELLHKDFVF